jgi:hypothetical protein
MALTVGTDTYISQADATTYVSGHYASTETNYTAWAALTSDNKDAYLSRAAVIIDRQPIVGVKAVETQTMEFPRAIYSNYKGGLDWPTISLDYSGNWYIQSSVPASVQYAQVEIALALAIGESVRVTAQREGVKSISLGSISESYFAASTANNVPSFEARELLRPYLAHSVGIA